MGRLTKNISGKQTYCGYEIKKCKYQQIYDFKKYVELEDYVDCDLTLAIDKLGKIEDIFELIEGMYKKPIYWESDDGKLNYDYYTHSTILYNPKTNEIEIYEHEFIAGYKVEEYGLTWWLSETKEE